jgi:formylmethanofuran dehydrogenase subunit C
MSGLTLKLVNNPSQRIDMSGFTPQRLTGKSLGEIEKLPLWLGNQQVIAAELFEFKGKPGEEITIQSDSDRLDQIGADLNGGTIRIEGNVGAYLGRGMLSGNIELSGDAGLAAGCAMSGGNLTIQGDAGDFLGGAITGERQGMRGGTILVKGSAGDRTGDLMRRGTIIVEGNCGDYCASRMVAGSLIVLGQLGKQTGLGMRRGTLLSASMPDSLPATFNHNGKHHLSFLSLFSKSLRAHPSLPDLTPRGDRVDRWLGDLACDGKGEILVWY